MFLFITFEGGEGCGKSFQAKALYRRLKRRASPALLTHEPGGTPLGRKLRRQLKRTEGSDISPLAELFLFNASRAQLVDEVIKPALGRGEIVVCDRFADSTAAYQSYGRGLALETVTAVNNAATGGLQPDLTVLLDIPPQSGLERKGEQRHDRFEQEALAFHQRVRDGYLKLAAGEPERWLVIDATLPKAKVEQIIWQHVTRLISQRNNG